MDTHILPWANIRTDHARALATATREPSSATPRTRGPPPLPQTWRARRHREVLRYMRPTAQAGPGTSRGGVHRQSKGGKARGAGRRGKSSVGSRAPGPVVPDAVPLLGGDDDGAEGTLPRPANATPLNPAADFPPALAHAAVGGAPSLGVATGPFVADGGSEKAPGGCDESTDEADGLSGIISDGGTDAMECAWAQDEPLLADRQGDAPRSMETEAGEAPPGTLRRLGG